MASRIAWGIAGAGHFLKEVADLVQPIRDVDLFLSRAAEEVIKMYRLETMISGGSRRVFCDPRRQRARS